MKYKEHTHFGVYGTVIKNDEILLIKKAVGPYEGLLDLPGGSLNFGESMEEALIRELKEETGFDISDFKLLDTFSTLVEWKNNKDLIMVNHRGIFYRINNYKGNIIENNKVDSINDDSLGASFYKIKELKKENLSKITILALEKIGYKL